MVDKGSEYQKKLGKEMRRRRIKIFRHVIGIILMAVLIIWVVLSDYSGTAWFLLIGLGIAYIIYVNYKLIKDVKTFFAYTDELHFEDGEIIKFNSALNKTKKRIPIENVEEVYFDIEDKPNLIFVVYSEKGGKWADSFYKQRIKGEEEFMEVLKKRSLVNEKRIMFQELKQKVEGSE